MKVRVVTISDLHLDANKADLSSLEAFVEKCNKIIQPDLVAVLGDIVTDYSSKEDGVNFLKQVKSILDCLVAKYVVVRGNRDLAEEFFFSVFPIGNDWVDVNDYRFVLFADDEWLDGENAFRPDVGLLRIRNARVGFCGGLIALQHMSLHSLEITECPYNLTNAKEVIEEMNKVGFLLSIGGHWHKGYVRCDLKNKPAYLINPAFSKEGNKYLLLDFNDFSISCIVQDTLMHASKMPIQIGDDGKSVVAISHIIKRSGAIVPYDRDRIRSAILRAIRAVNRNDNGLAEVLSKKVEDKLIQNYGVGATPSVEEIQDMVEQVLYENGETQILKAYSTYRQQRALLRATRQESFEVRDNIPYKKIYEILCWNMEHSCTSISDLNALISKGKFVDLIRESDLRLEKEIDECFVSIMSKSNYVRIIIIAGPSSSGKTTITIKLSERLAKEGLEFCALTVDNYFFDLECHPKDEFGDYDYETPQALDLQLINEHLVKLLNGETVYTPYYDFKTGERRLNAIEMKLKPNQLLLIDSLHGLYDDMTKAVPAENKFKLYVETLDQLKDDNGIFLRWADHRLLRRMIRDSLHRNSTPEMTITHWHYVRRSELKYIIPFIGNADFLINTALPYELPILKSKLFHYFPETMKKYRNDAARQDAYIRAKRLYEFLLPLIAIEDDSFVSPTSLLREFIGGSSYSY